MSKMSIKKLNLKLHWDQEFQKVALNQRFDNYIQITNFLDEIDDVCQGGNIKVLNRIGSRSQNAEVYRARLGDVEFAMKVIPFDYERNFNEISIAEEVSEAVLEGRTTRFPIVYGKAECEDTLFYSDKRPRGKSSLLFSELGLCDLEQYISFFGPKGLKEDEVLYIAEECIKSIKDLHKLGISHNDLHLGNFLLIPENKSKDFPYGYKILIHDFGTAERRENNLELEFDTFSKFYLSKIGKFFDIKI